MRLLDLFCGAGGCSVGYARAGFEVVGVDIEPQPNYPFEFHQADALDVLYAIGETGAPSLGRFDAIHASPPCQHYANVTKWRGNSADHAALIAPTRDLLEMIGVPWVMENVRTKELRGDLVLCGSQFGLPIRRHRYFECSFPVPVLLEPCQHRRTDLPFEHKGERAYADAMGCDWMSKFEARQAIPPAYTEYVGDYLLGACGWSEAQRDAAFLERAVSGGHALDA